MTESLLEGKTVKVCMARTFVLKGEVLSENDTHLRFFDYRSGNEMLLSRTNLIELTVLPEEGGER